MGFRVEIDPAAPALPDDGRPLIFLARHAGPGDSFALVWLILAHWNRTPRVVLKNVLLWDPGLDVMLTRLSGCFLPSRSGAGDDTTDLVAASAGRLSPGDALLLFPEGGNWTPGRQRRAVVVVAHAGLDQLTSVRRVWEAIPVTDTPMSVSWWRVAANEAPSSEEEVADWLNGQWGDVARWVTNRTLPESQPLPG